MALDGERSEPALTTKRPAHAHARAVAQHFDEVSLVEPDRLDDAGLVAQDGAHDGHPAARRLLGAHPLHAAAHRGLLPHPEIADELAFTEIGVAPREVADQVADSLEAEGGQARGDRAG